MASGSGQTRIFGFNRLGGASQLRIAVQCRGNFYAPGLKASLGQARKGDRATGSAVELVGGLFALDGDRGPVAGLAVRTGSLVQELQEDNVAGVFGEVDAHVEPAVASCVGAYHRLV